MRKRYLFAAGAAALVAALAAFPDVMIAPGRLLHGHAQFADDCFACHRPFQGTPAEKCLACHHATGRPSGAAMAARFPSAKPLAAFHQKFRQKNCAACHIGHEGMKLYRGDLF